MTKWQWNIIVILCKIVLRMLEVGTPNTIVSEDDLNCLREAVIRDDEHTFLD